jgi:asparagine synthase (glutamine-hydrolysing)
MCGIAGVVGEWDDALLERLGASLRHRGPDEGGVVTDGEVALVARRLAIVDVEGGNQPMTSPSGRSTIVFNGEVFNAPELRRRLEASGRRFATDHSDTEVVLALWEERGEAALRELNGMFAFALLDRERRELVLVRDRLGIKPLYYADEPFAFASELRTLLHVPGIERELDRESLFHYLSLRFVPSERSILHGVRRLPPGHLLRYDLETRRRTTSRWWRLEFRRDETAHERLRDELAEAVKRWTLSDVPIAVSLSGGLDSGTVAALLAQSGAHVRTYTVGFAEGDDERRLAEDLARRWGTEHHEIVVAPDELLDNLLEMVWALDEPYGGGLPSWFVYRFMAEDVKVGLTGTGGDELFGSYRRFVPFERARLRRLRGADVRRYHFEPSYYFRDDEKRTLGVDGPDTAALLQHVYDESGSESPRDSVLYLDASTQLPDEFLHVTDRFSMAWSLEARTPFLDHELVELVASIPPERRTDADDPKRLLRESVGDLLTEGHLHHPKRGFVFPLAQWLRRELRPLAERLLDDDHLRRQAIFRPGLAERYLQPHLDLRADESERLWPLLMFQLWHLLYIEEALTDPPTFSWRELTAGVP